MAAMDIKSIKEQALAETARILHDRLGVVPDPDSEEWEEEYRRQFDLLKKQAAYREGVNFYVLRHTFRTIADAARDPVAIDLIMGHSDPSMGGHYRERIDDSRLRAVAELVRQWLIGKAQDGGKTGPASGTSETSDPPQRATGSN